MVVGEAGVGPSRVAEAAVDEGYRGSAPTPKLSPSIMIQMKKSNLVGKFWSLKVTG